MARFGFSDADNYGQQNTGSFFTLKDDKDTAKVRFLYKTIDDIEGYVVHQVDIGDKKRYVNCLRSYNEPVDNCPLCKAGYKQIPKMFLKLFNEDVGEAQIWERGKTYFQRMAGLASHFNPLCNEVVEIQRNGKKGDMQTTYEFYPTGTSMDAEAGNFDIDSVECSEPLGTIILDKNADEMEQYLNLGDFPDNASGVAEQRSGDQIQRRTPNNPTTSRRAF